MECVFTSLVRTEGGMLLMHCMQCFIHMTVVLYCVDVLSRGGISLSLRPGSDSAC